MGLGQPGAAGAAAVRHRTGQAELTQTKHAAVCAPRGLRQSFKSSEATGGGIEMKSFLARGVYGGAQV